MKKTYNFTLLLILTLIACLAFAACSDADKEELAKMPKTDTSTANNLPYDSLIIELQGSDSLTALDVLMQTHEVDCINTAAGAFVRAIDSINSSDDFFWLYSVNDDMPQIAADRYSTRDGDVVKWHFRRINK